MLDIASKKTELILSLGGDADVTNLFNIKLTGVQNKTMLKSTKNHANWLRRFKDRQTNLVAYFWRTLLY